MDTIQSVSLNIPSSDMDFLKQLVHKMDWTLHTAHKTKQENMQDTLSYAEKKLTDFAGSLAARKADHWKTSKAKCLIEKYQ